MNGNPVERRFDPLGEALRTHWGTGLAIGIAFLVLGVVAVAYAGITTLAAVVVLGVVLLAAGGVHAYHAFTLHRTSGMLIGLLGAAIYGVLGFALVSRPGLGAAGLTAILATFLLVAGVWRGTTAVFVRFEGWGWALASGVVSALLGVLLWAQWPISSFWTLGTFVGAELMVHGASWVAISLFARQHVRARA